MKNKLKEKKWYANAVAACIAVVLYVVLMHISPIAAVIQKFIGYFSSIILGLVLAYLMNPLAKWYQKMFFRRLNNEKLQWTISVVLTVITTLLLIVFILIIFIPQMAGSVYTLVNNMDGYLESLNTLLSRFGLDERLNLDAIMDSLLGVNGKIVTFLKENANNILNVSAAAGMSVANFAISFILSVYMLMSKDSLKKGMLRFMHAVIPDKRYSSTLKFLSRCDGILSSYIVFTLLDAIIVGGINAVFMAIMGMEYVGLVSLLVAVMNLIPTFGPIIGGAIGGFILLLVSPVDALVFVLFTLLLQFFDGYIIKPKLFGNKLGVSGLLILAAIIVCGNIWGIVGILLAIPLAAILDFVCREEILPALERRRTKLSGTTEE